MKRLYNDSLSAKLHYLNIQVGWLNLYDNNKEKILDIYEKAKKFRGYNKFEFLMKSLKKVKLTPYKHKGNNGKGYTTNFNKILNFHLKRLDYWKECCNDDCKYLYFCSRPKGHLGSHIDAGGLIWEQTTNQKHECMDHKVSTETRNGTLIECGLCCKKFDYTGWHIDGEGKWIYGKWVEDKKNTNKRTFLKVKAPKEGPHFIRLRDWLLFHGKEI
jgi:hypothetical protein